MEKECGGTLYGFGVEESAAIGISLRRIILYHDFRTPVYVKKQPGWDGSFRMIPQVFILRPARRSMRMKTVLFGALLGIMVFTGLALADLFEIKEAVEGAVCRKLATDYANDPTTLTIQAIAQLQICLAQTLKNTASPGISRNFDIESSRPSTGMVETILPTPPTPPTPPKSLKIR